MKVPLLENFFILLLTVSVTYTLPDDGSIAMPSGDLRVPLAPPSLPNMDMKVPLLENFCILLLTVSATYTLPDDGSIAMSSGDDKLVSSVPNSLQVEIKAN